MTLKYMILTGLIGMIPLLAGAQPENDSLIFSAMKDELQRNKENLVLENSQKPFFIAYTLQRTSKYSVKSSLGALVDITYNPLQVIGAVEVWVGDYFRGSCLNSRNLQLKLPIEPDYNEIRRHFWLATDKAYKSVLQQYIADQNYFKAYPRSEEKLADYTRCEVKNYITTKTTYKFDRKLWEERIAQLSAIFKRYPELYDTKVELSAVQTTIYKVTTEGLVLKELLQEAKIFMSAFVRTSQGTKTSDSWYIKVDRLDQLPDMPELEKQIVDLAENLLRWKEAKPIEEYYCGPVMLEGQASDYLWNWTLFKAGRLISWRPRIRNATGEFDEQIGRKIMDSRLSIINYTNWDTYHGKPLYGGSYEVDAEGVEPPRRLVLVEKGVLKAQLNGRIPTLKAPGSTGSSRFLLNAGWISFSTNPGVVHVFSSEGIKPDKMKKELLKAAANKGLKYAYIFRKIGLTQFIYKVDVKTGQETLVQCDNTLLTIQMKQLEQLVAISADEYISDRMIFPRAVIINDIVIRKPDLHKEKVPVLTNPLLR